jgi:predicted dehydrogenase
MKALFVGLGSIGQRHLRNLIQLKPNIELIAVRSSRASPTLNENNEVIQGKSIKDLYEIEEYESLSKALRKNPDLVFITNPSSLHVATAIKALNSGSFVFIEKPLSHQWQGVDELLRLEKLFNQKKVSVGYQFRFHPALNHIKKLLNEKAIGNVVNARFVNGEYMPNWHPYEDYRYSYAARNELGGGALVTQIHDIDLSIWLFGNPNKLFTIGGQLSNLEIDVEDSVQLLLEFTNNETNFPVSINLDYLQWPPEKSITIIGDKGSIKCDLINMEVIINNRINDSKDIIKYPNFSRNDMFLEEMKNFLSFAEGNEKPAVDLETASDSLRIALAAKKAMISGKIQITL